ncbi:trimethyllysine dioxygenase, mitochondrial [Condylostylus longicornis]|uniref:trimethyllysine dioxygenase, mitochondrial n=1 Tax=Condylostylus longicornis TaxID=2530218 RepID=UPI00244DB389|nr:trimethyllysine dioxygenase, mitochondrial [Condylostylus longicornis]
MPFQVTRDPVERSCCVPVCKNQKCSLSHRFPIKEQKCNEWLAALEIPKLYEIPKEKLCRSYFVCTRHFRYEDYKHPTSRHLNTTAVPSINIKDLSQLNLVESRWKSDNKIKKNRQNIICQAQSDNVQDAAVIDLVSEYDVQEPDAADATIYVEIDQENEIAENCSILNSGLKRVSPFPLENQDTLHIENKKSKTNKEHEEHDSFTCRGGENQLLELEENEETDVKDVSSILTINHPNYEEEIDINLFWLRDHCKCNLCYNHEMYQRKTNILDIPLDISVLQTGIKDEKLIIKWEDEHESEYDLDFLYKNQFKKQPLLKFTEYFLWDKTNITNDGSNKFIEVDFGHFLSNEKQAVAVVESLVKFGIAFIKNVPPTTDMTELSIKRLFPIQKTLFGEMWTFTSNKNRADTAYTTEYLGPHTDNTYFSDAAGLQIFHCIEFEGSGGDSIFVDGFNAIEKLGNEDPEALKILSTINVPAEYIDKGQHHKYSAPIIQLDPITLQPKQIRFNLYDRSDFNEIELSKIKPFYKSLKKLAQIVNDEKNILTYKLDPGTIVLFNNWRILHGRKEFSGLRVMTGCYVSRTDFMSKARTLGLVA